MQIIVHVQETDLFRKMLMVIEALKEERAAREVVRRTGNMQGDMLSLAVDNTDKELAELEEMLE